MSIENREYNLNINIENNSLLVNFIDYNGNVLKSLSIIYPISDEKILKSSPQPTQTYESGNYDYTFNHTWSKMESDSAIVFKPNYSSNRIVLTIKWNNYDGTLLQTKTYNKGDIVPSYTGGTPVRPDDAYRYTFSKWSNASIDGRVITYTAQYTSAKLYTWKKYNTATRYQWYIYTLKPIGSVSTLIEKIDVPDDIAGTSLMIVGTFCNVSYGNSTSDFPLTISNGVYTLLNAQTNSSWIYSEIPTYGICIIDRPLNIEHEWMKDINTRYSTTKYTCGNRTSGAICSKLFPNKYYVYSLNTTPLKGNLYSSSASTNLSAYPSDGILGDYWYTVDRSKDSIVCGSDTAIIVKSTNSSQYPSNGKHSDGYWYIKQ